MPYSMTEEGGRYTVRSPSGVKAKRTTKAKAKAQMRLLNAIDHGWEPSRKQRHHSCANGSFLDSRISKFNVQRN